MEESDSSRKIMQQVKNNPAYRILNRIYPIVFFALGSTLLYFSFRHENIGEILSQLRNLKGAVLWLLLPSIFSRLLVGLSQYYLVYRCAPGKCSPWQIIRSSVSSMAINDVMPFLKFGGEAYKVSYYTQFLGLSKAIQVVALFSIAYIIGHLILFWVALGITIWKFNQSDFPATLYLPTFLLTSIAIGFLLAKALQVGKKQLQRLVENRPKFKQALDLLNERPKVILIATFIYTVGRLLEPVEVYIALQELGYSISLLDAVWLDGGSTLANNILFFFPYSIGIREGAYKLMGNHLALDASISLVASTIGRIRMLIWAVIGLLLILVPNQKKKLSNLP